MRERVKGGEGARDQETSEEADLANWHVLVTGLEIEGSTLSLGPGLVLRRLPKRLSAFDLAACGAAGFREWAVLEPLASLSTAEIQFSSEPPPTRYGPVNRVWLASALMVLRGFHRFICPALSEQAWSEIAGHVTTPAEYRDGAKPGPRPALQPFRGGLLDFHLRVIAFDDGSQPMFGESEAQWTREHLPTFDRLAAESEKFRFALEAAVDSRYARDERAALARVWSGIESLFEINHELSFRLSLYIAIILAPRGQPQLDLFKKANDLYGLRSKAVHGAQLDAEKLTKGLRESWNLLRLLLLDAVLRGAVRSDADIKKAIFT